MPDCFDVAPSDAPSNAFSIACSLLISPRTSSNVSLTLNAMFPPRFLLASKIHWPPVAPDAFGVSSSTSPNASGTTSVTVFPSYRHVGHSLGSVGRCRRLPQPAHFQVIPLIFTPHFQLLTQMQQPPLLRWPENRPLSCYR